MFLNRQKALARDFALSLIYFALASCATIHSSREAITQLHLFGDDHVSHFSFYYSCAGDVSAETETCWVPSKYFALWADARRVTITELPESAFDAAKGIPADRLSKNDSSFEYRIYVRFHTIITPSDYHPTDGRVDYTPPKAGYKTDIYAYAVSNGALVLHTDFHHKSETGARDDAVPFIKDGVAAVLTALDPGYKLAQ
jgi:hypothetical protein